MKNLSYLLLLCFLCVSCSSTRPRKSDVVSLSFSYDTTTALEYTNTIPVSIKLHRRDGKLKRAQRNNSDRVTIVSPQGMQVGKSFRFDRGKVSKNGHNANLYITYTKDSSVTLTDSFSVPYITNIQFQALNEECTPGKVTKPKLAITHSSGKQKITGIQSGSRAKSLNTDETELLEQVLVSTNNVRLLYNGITPVIAMDTLITEAKITAKSKFDSTVIDSLTIPISYNVQEHFSFNGRSGYDGRRGTNGRDGYDGGNGDDGRHGGHGRAGTNGSDVKIYVVHTEKENQTFMKIWAHSKAKRDSVIINAHTGHLHISSNGGKGGNGGNGGNGGDGSDADSTHTEGEGGKGGDGGHGGTGGNGGTLTLYCDSLSLPYLNKISYENFGGQGGSAGQGGTDGDDGDGDSKSYNTKAGAVLGFLGSVANAIFSGSRGNDGQEGYAGESGPQMEIVVLPNEKLQAKISSMR